MEYIKSVATGATRSDETKDCSVRALSSAAEMHYDDAHELLAYHGRNERRGCNGATLMDAYSDAGFNDVTVFGTTKSASYYSRNFANKITKTENGITLRNFCKKYNKGRYIVSYNGHALAVVNGEVIDRGSNPANKRVVIAFKRSVK